LIDESFGRGNDFVLAVNQNEGTKLPTTEAEKKLDCWSDLHGANVFLTGCAMRRGRE